ncbi:MAG: type II secretion system protein [Candidatus Omnitrophica bacterium]|nr:type II secretion system protein [Candidatus Omnitrophota bacterium]
MLKGKKGYTIVESLIAMAIFTLIIGTLFTMLISQNNFFSQSRAKMDVSSAARKAMTVIIKEMRLCKVEYVEVYNLPIDQGGVIDHTDATSIKFQVPVDWDGDGDFFNEYGIIEWGAEGQEDYALQYYWDSANERIIRRVWDSSANEDSFTVIAEDIFDFKINGFKYNSASQNVEPDSSCEIVEIEITARRSQISGRSLANPLTYTLSNRVAWRN